MEGGQSGTAFSSVEQEERRLAREQLPLVLAVLVASFFEVADNVRSFSEQDSEDSLDGGWSLRT